MAQIQRFGSSPNIADSAVRGFQQGEAISNQPLRRRSAELGVKSQEQGIQQGQAEQDRFLEESNIQSIVNGALQFQAIDKNNIPAQNDFLLKRINEIEIRKGDARDTIEMLKMSPEDRQKTMGAILQIGQQKGLIKGAAQQSKQDLTTMAKGLVEEGFKIGSPEFQAELQKRRTAEKPSLVTVQTGDAPLESQDIEFKKALGKQQAKRFDDIVRQGENAQNTIAALDQLDNIDVAKGLFEPAKVELARVLQGFGIDSSTLANVANAQSFNAVSTKLVNEVLNAAKGPQTDQDAARAKKTIASLGDDPRAAAFKNNALRALALRKVEQQQFMESQIDAGATFSKAIKEWNVFKNNTPSLGKIISKTDGLPVFFYQYRNFQQATKPDITEQEIAENWRVINGK